MSLQENLEARRGQIALIAAVAGIVVIVFLNFVLPDQAARILLDKGGRLYPFSVQSFMWVAFAIGLGELYVRYAAGREEEEQVRRKYLPEDNASLLMREDLPAIYRRVRAAPEAERCFLPRLIARCSLQFQASQSVDQSSTLLNTSTEMFLHEIDLRYGMLRYICWVIPSLGFIGTVIGIGLALEYAGDPANVGKTTLLSDITQRLAVSFNGTLVALLMASILVFLQSVTQSKEEHALNNASQYCLDNLINRLFVGEVEDRRA